MDGLRRDLFYALRLLIKSPAFALVAIGSLSLGIGVNTAIFSVMNAVDFRSLAVPHPERLVQVSSIDSQGRFTLLSYPQLEQLRARQTVFSSVAGWLLPVLNIELNGVPSRSAVLVVTEDYYSTFPVHAILGRPLSQSDWHSPQGGIANVAVISYQCWQNHFGRSPAVLGQTIRVEGKPFSIIGVMPVNFSSPQIDVSADVTVPVEISPLSVIHGGLVFNRETTVLFTSARLRHGISLRQARTQLSVLWPSILKDTQPSSLNSIQSAEFLRHRIRVESGARGQSFLRNQFTGTFHILTGVVAILLLLVCINLASLLLARSASRTGEINLRLALGAGRSRLVRQLFTESLLLSAISALAGVLLAFWFSRILLPFMWFSPIPLTISVTPDGRVLAFTIVVTVAATIFFGLAPGWMAITEAVNSGLRQGARSIVNARGSWMRRMLVPGQVGLALALLVSAGLLFRMAHRLETKDLGFQPRHVAIMFLNPNPGGYHNTNMVSYERDLLNQVSSVPGVTSAALSNGLPVGTYDWNEQVSARSSRASQATSVECSVQAASYGFFKTLETSVLRGREFLITDTPATKHVVIISESAAKRLFPSGNAVGHTIAIGKDPSQQNLEIVGIVQDARFGRLDRTNPLMVFLPMFQYPKLLRYAVLEVRTTADPLGVVPSVSKTIRALNREYSFWAESLERVIAVNLASERMLASLSTFFAVVALSLAVIGLYGLLAFTVSHRMREFGVRMALGADWRRIFRSILGEALVLLLVGVAVGIPLAFAAAKVLSSRLPAFKAGDPVIFAFASVLLIAVGAVSAAIPAWRAASVDPSEALRAE
jgi:predicted permease